MGIIVAACVSQFHGSDDEFELLLAYDDGREIGHTMTRSAARQIADEISNAIGDGAPERRTVAGQQSGVSAIEAIEKAIEHATQGEWVIHGGMLGHNGDIFSPTAKRVPDCHHIARFFAPKPANPALCELQAIQIMRNAVAISEANAAYVAACSPDRMREVLALARQAVALQRENAELREALRPFAECAPEWEGEPDSLHVFFEWNDEGAPVPSLPVADFRRARALLGGENAE